MRVAPELARRGGPILCYVTDRRGLARRGGPQAPDATSDVPPGKRHPEPVRALQESIRRAAAAGVDWIQIREKDLEARALLKLARLARAEARGTAARVLVNDRFDVALAAGAAGVHFGESSLPVEIVADWRRSVRRSEFIIGVSCHSSDSARSAAQTGADYIFFGPVFATPSKAAFGPPQGIERLREVCALVDVPVLAIGGVSLENARACLEAGAAGIAAIRLFQDVENLAETIAKLKGTKR